MVSTRAHGDGASKQATLSVDKNAEVGVEVKDEEKGKSEENDQGQKQSDGATDAGTKRKETDDQQAQGSKENDADEHDPKSKNGGEGEPDDSDRPAKAPKTETKQEENDNQAQPNSGSQPTKAEQHLSGKDEGSVGAGQSTVTWEILERGHIYFFYRPKVQPAQAAGGNEPAAKSIDDTQNFHLLLLPQASDSSTAPAKPSSQQPSDAENKSETTGEKAKQAGIGARLIRLGKKRMPEPEAALKQGDQPGGIGGDTSEAIWAVVSDVSSSFDNLKQAFEERRYTTKTSGERVVQGARPVGRGRYVISLSQTDPPSSREVRLSYALSHPHEDKDFGDVQKELGLNKTSSCRLQMRNPTLPSTGAGAPPAGLDPSSRVRMDDSELKEQFGGDSDQGTRYGRPENIDYLDRAGVELLMIKKREQETEEDFGMGETHQKAIEKIAADEAKKLSNKDVLQELRLDGENNPAGALDGEWI